MARRNQRRSMLRHRPPGLNDYFMLFASNIFLNFERQRFRHSLIKVISKGVRARLRLQSVIPSTAWSTTPQRASIPLVLSANLIPLAQLVLAIDEKTGYGIHKSIPKTHQYGP